MATPDTAIIEGLGQEAAEAAETFHMEEDAFRAFYDRTARSVWAYLSRVTGSPVLADDLLQEAYYRFLRARTPFDNEAHRRNYLFRIATNLVHDHRRQQGAERKALEAEACDAATSVSITTPSREQSADVRRALARLKPRERAMLWLAYAEGSSHEEIATALGVRAKSVRVMLHRARGRLRRLLGFDTTEARETRR